jgi:hypothetical protein
MKPTSLPNASAKAVEILDGLDLQFKEIEFPTLPDQPDLPNLADLPGLPEGIEPPMATEMPEPSLPEQAQVDMAMPPVDIFDFFG